MSGADPLLSVDPLTRVDPSRRRRLLGPVGLGVGVAAAALALHLRDPHSQSWGLCPFLELTGLYCPGCGGLRAVNDLTNLDVVSAASSNLLFVVTLPVVIGLWLVWLVRAWRGDPARVDGAGARASRRGLQLGWVALALAGVFLVVRNLPGLEWLTP